MIELPSGLLGRDFDFGSGRVTSEQIERYARTVGDRDTLARLARGEGVAPPTFCLALHRGMRPEVELPPDCFGIYGGHDLDFLQPLRAGESYGVHARIADVYEKSGRSGALLIVAREGEIRDAAGRVAVRIHERQIVRRRPADSPRALPHVAGEGRAVGAAAPDLTDAPPPAPVADVELGTEIGPQHRPPTAIEQVGLYVGCNDMREGLFTDRDFARALGYRDIVVPGPMLTAFLEQFVRATLPSWRLERLGSTFRMPTITGDPLTLSGVVSEHHESEEGEYIVCDLVVEHPTGERAVTATARLRRGA